ncbi:glycosyltransferase family 4 protein [Methylocystis silviterrae]|uniref:glycosyltransferase family 4 protein n=1 Tax=Methylocystis silviterrae TaxID=2743612 RepID=UPI003C7533E2
MEQQIEHESEVALFLASQIQQENMEMTRRRMADALDPVTAFVYFKLKEFYWTMTRQLGLAHLHDGSRTRRRLSPKRRPLLPRELASDDTFSLVSSGRVFIDVTPTLRFGGKTGVQRVVREIAKRSIRDRFALPVIVENGELLSYYDHPSLPRSVKFREGDRFVLLDASWGILSEHLPFIQGLADVGGQLITVLHDLIPLIHPLSVSPEMTDEFNAWFEKIVLKSDRIICVSKSTAMDLIAYVTRNNLATKPHLRIGWWRLGADFDSEEGAPPSAEAKAVTANETPYFVSVGTLEPRKGYPIALEAFERLWLRGVDARYVIIGRAGWQSDALAHRIKQHQEFGRRLLWLENASDADLRHCYTHACALVYPSMIEGFGIPLVEAGRYGLPVIASDLPVFHETGGDHVRYFNLLDSIDLADKIEKLYREPIEKEKMPIYSWDDSARNLVNLISNEAYQTRIQR